jgi:hypothetical protein
MMSLLIFKPFDSLLSSEILLFFESTHPHAEFLLIKNSVYAWLSYYHLITLSVFFIFKIFTGYFTKLNSPCRLTLLWSGFRWWRRGWGRWLTFFFNMYLICSYFMFFFHLLPLNSLFFFSLFSLNFLMLYHNFWFSLILISI